MVIFLVGLVSMILMRTLRKDYARYSKEEEMDDMVRCVVSFCECIRFICVCFIREIFNGFVLHKNRNLRENFRRKLAWICLESGKGNVFHI